MASSLAVVEEEVADESASSGGWWEWPFVFAWPFVGDVVDSGWLGLSDESSADGGFCLFEDVRSVGVRSVRRRGRFYRSRRLSLVRSQLFIVLFAWFLLLLVFDPILIILLLSNFDFGGRLLFIRVILLLFIVLLLPSWAIHRVSDEELQAMMDNVHEPCRPDWTRSLGAIGDMVQLQMAMKRMASNRERRC